MDEERSENTIDAYVSSVRLFFSSFDDLTKANMLAYKHQQMEQWKPKTANARVIAMNKYAEYAGKPECKIKGVKIHKSSAIENVITLEEYERIRNGLLADGNEKGYWMITYLAKTGARVSEFVRLDKSCFDRGYCEMWTKGKIRRIYVPKSLIAKSRPFFDRQDSNVLFLNRYGDPMTTRGVSQSIHAWAERYGVRPEVAHPHSFRHLFAKEFLKRNNNISLLADVLGHSSVDTTAIYLKMSREEQMEAFNNAMG